MSFWQLPHSPFYLTSRQLSPLQDWSFMSRWFMSCSVDGSTFFTTFSNWCGSDFRSYTSTNDCGRKQGEKLSIQPSKLCTHPCHTKWRTYLTVRKLTVLQVVFFVKGPDAGVRVVVGIFAHTVGETLLRNICWISAVTLRFYFFFICFCHTRTHLAFLTSLKAIKQRNVQSSSWRAELMLLWDICSSVRFQDARLNKSAKMIAFIINYWLMIFLLTFSEVFVFIAYITLSVWWEQV